MANIFKALYSSRRHLTAEQLVGLLENEEGARPHARLRAHLDTCWDCQSRYDQLRNTIFEFMEFRKERLKPYMPPSPDREQQLLRLLEAEDRKRSAQLHSLTWFARNIRSIGRTRLTAPIAGVAVVTLMVTGIALLLSKPQPVSAAVILRRAIAKESVLPPAGEVIHCVYRVERRSFATGKILSQDRVETWSDTSTQRSARRLFDNDGHLIAGEWTKRDGSQILLEAALHKGSLRRAGESLLPEYVWRASPSASWFRSLTAGTTPRIVLDTPTAYVLQAQGSRSWGNVRLLSATIELHKPDLRAVGQTLTVHRDGQEDEYRYVETSLSECNAGQVAEAVFTPDPALLPRPRPVRATPPVISVPLPTVAGPALVLDALTRLDRSGVLARGQVQLRRSAIGPVLIEGILDDAQERQQVIAALGPLVKNPLVRLSLQTSAEAEASTPAPSEPLSVQTVNIPVSRIPIDTQIRAYLRSIGVPAAQLDSQVQQFANSIIEHSSAAGSNVQAINEILDGLGRQNISQLDAADRQRLLTILRPHVQAVLEETSTVRRQWESIFPSALSSTLSAPGVSSAPSNDFPSLMARLARLVMDNNQKVLAACAVSPVSDSATPIKPADLADSLDLAASLAGRVLTLTTIDLGGANVATPLKSQVNL